VIAEKAKSNGGLQADAVLPEAVNRLEANKNEEIQRAILVYWNDLFRAGQIGWGANISAPNPPFCHLTDNGRETLKHLSRDPMNPDGYMRYLRQVATVSPIADSYVQEALKTYEANCHKATAVMIGAASESLILDLRDSLQQRLQALSRVPSFELKAKNIHTVHRAINKTLSAYFHLMPVELKEEFESYWLTFAQQIRAGRNRAGHPNSINPVTPEIVHSAMLAFPQLAIFTTKLKKWLATANL
jgi:hypothetical protein